MAEYWQALRTRPLKADNIFERASEWGLKKNKKNCVFKKT